MTFGKNSINGHKESTGNPTADSLLESMNVFGTGLVKQTKPKAEIKRETWKINLWKSAIKRLYAIQN